ncbi:hypothetical protein P7C73_g2942, partial [Tremellales sp. Uapishka_1]
MSLAGKNVLVTGSSRGIGAQIARDVALEGANVIVNHSGPSSKGKAEAVAQQITDGGGKAWVVQADMGSLEAGPIFAKAVKELLPGGRIDCIVHNAGVTADKALWDITPEDFEFVMNVNVRGILFVTQALQPLLNKLGRIVIMSSVAARAAIEEDSLYGGSKAHIEHYVRSWHKENWAKDLGITVNGLNPGPVDTDMFNALDPKVQEQFTSIMPTASTSAISNLCLFLLSEKAQWTNGSILNANNGSIPV